MRKSKVDVLIEKQERDAQKGKIIGWTVSALFVGWFFINFLLA